MSAVIVLGLMVAAIPQSAWSAKLPDLVVVSVSTQPGSVPPGTEMKITDKVSNKGTAKASASTSRYYLSKDAKKNSGDVRLEATRSVKALAPKAASQGSTNVAIPSTVVEGSYYVVACADDTKKVKESNEKNNCRASPDLISVIAPPTSFDLIDQAIASGEIDAETGLLYKVFATVGDDRLPAEYSGDDGELFDTSIMREAAEQFDSLTPEAKGILIPFLRAPAYPGTWEELDSVKSRQALRRPQRAYDSGSTKSVTHSTEPPMHPTPLGERGWWFFEHQRARIWFREDELGHQELIAGEIFEAIPKVWGDLTALMGREPMSDIGPHKFVDNNGQPQEWGDGGSGLLDIYVVESSSSFTVTYPPGCTERPSFIVLGYHVIFGKDRPRDVLRDVLAHEFMHVLQFTYKYAKACKEYESWDESVAHWAIDYVYPEDNSEHLSAAFLVLPSRPYWQVLTRSRWGLGRAGYDGWVFPLFLEHALGAQVIPAIYAQASQKGPWEAVDAAIGGLKERWPEFSRHAWNQEPVESFKEWDDFLAFPEDEIALQVYLGGQGDQLSVPIEVNALNRQYDRFSISDEVLYLEFQNGALGKPGAAVEALIKLRDGTWKPVADWTDEEKVTFCRDRPSEDVVELVVITSNSTFGNLDDVLTGSHKVAGRADCLPIGFTGTFSGTKEGSQEQGYSGPTETWTATGITLERVNVPSNDENGKPFQAYNVTGGSVTYTISGGSPCSWNGSATFSLSPEPPQQATGGHLDLEVRPVAGHGRRYKADVDDYSPHQFDITVDCEEDSFTSNWYARSDWSTGGGYLEAQQGDSLVDTYDPPRGNSGEDFKWEWNFTPQYEGG